MSWQKSEAEAASEGCPYGNNGKHEWQLEVDDHYVVSAFCVYCSHSVSDGVIEIALNNYLQLVDDEPKNQQ